MMRHILCELLGKHVNTKTVGKFTFGKDVIFRPSGAVISKSFMLTPRIFLIGWNS